MADIQSRPYNPAQCCELCVFGRGEHAKWCVAKDRALTTVSWCERSGKPGDLAYSITHHSKDCEVKTAA